MILKIFNWLEKPSTKFWSIINKIIRFIFLPIILIIELIVYSYFWKKIILLELIENQKIFEFLNKNEFALTKGRLVKKDIFDDKAFYDELSLDDAKEKIKEEFVNRLAELIDKNISINIEMYITLLVTTNTKLTKINHNYFENKIYTVNIQFCRYYIIQQLFKQSIYWLSILIGLSIFFVVL